MQVFKKIIAYVSIVATCSAMLSTAGCRVLRPASERLVHDSVFITRTVVKRDTILKAGPASVSVAVQIPCPELSKVTPVQKQFKHAKVTLQVKGDSLIADCLCDTNAIKAQLNDTYEKMNHTRTEASTRTVVAEKKYVPGWVSFLAWSGGGFWMLLLIGVYIKHFKR